MIATISPGFTKPYEHDTTYLKSLLPYFSILGMGCPVSGFEYTIYSPLDL